MDYVLRRKSLSYKSTLSLVKDEEVCLKPKVPMPHAELCLLLSWGKWFRKGKKTCRLISNATISPRVHVLLGLGITQQPAPGAMFKAPNDKNLR